MLSERCCDNEHFFVLIGKRKSRINEKLSQGLRLVNKDLQVDMNVIVPEPQCHLRSRCQEKIFTCYEQTTPVTQSNGSHLSCEFVFSIRSKRS
jgi:hypothetical protein